MAVNTKGITYLFRVDEPFFSRNREYYLTMVMSYPYCNVFITLLLALFSYIELFSLLFADSDNGIHPLSKFVIKSSRTFFKSVSYNSDVIV